METTNFLQEILKISLVALIAYISYYYYKYFTRENPLPGPFPLPLIGNIHQVLKNGSFDMNKFQAKYGDLCEFYTGSQRFILLSNDDLIKKIMKPTVRGPFHNRVNDDNEGLEEIGLLNTGLSFNNNYDNWRFHRKFYTKVMMSTSLIKQSVIVVRNSFLEMEKYWNDLGEDTIFEFNHWMKRYFFDTIFIISSNNRAYALANYYNKVTKNGKLSLPESLLKESNTFVESINVAVQSFQYFFILPRMVLHLPIIKRYTQYLKGRIYWIRNNVNNIIKSRREEISKTPIDQKLKSDILTMFLTVNTERDITERIADDLHDEPMSDKEVQRNFVEIMGAGIDTSSNSLCFLVDFLENNPKAKQRMIEEIERVLGKDPNSSFTFEDLSKLEYVEAVILESSRIRSVIPLILKTNSVPEVVGSYRWSKNTCFGLNFGAIQKQKSSWKDPEKFNPDRFMDNPDSKNKVYMFGGGLRICPGRNLAMMGLKATLVMLYRKYDIELLGPSKEHIGIVRTCDELKVKLKKRKNVSM
ncbi:hypothetical protein Glove_109g161 [Diversispora epigaea]|uniref:Cytochrome P450 n=1 Tax=Diversispora epigaea TaxID=1348612 RepID=A0A397JBZ8_9GLOM|nr:hypothetical protein Glove_109g161 [Diversispora epigaea]